MIRQLKKLEPYLSFDKYTKNIPLCCHIFFEYVQNTIRSTIPEYGEANIHDSENGILFCPECVIQKIRTSTENQNE